MSERLGAEGAGAEQRENGFQMGEGADSDQGDEGSDRGSWGRKEGQFGEQCVYTVYPRSQRGGGLCLWRGPRNKGPGAAWAPAPPSQLRDSELITTNEQLGLVSWDLYW